MLPKGEKMAVYYLPPEPIFPDPLTEEVDDIVAIGGNLSPETIIIAYKKGIFPWYDENSPILWWSPDPRLVLFPHELHIQKRLKRLIRQKRFHIGINTAFERVINLCASLRREKGEGTWLIPEMVQAYTELHHLGYAHCVETWEKGKLVGGLYGVSLGRVFFGESMFYKVSNASKVAFVSLVLFLRRAGYYMIDCQQVTSHLIRFGARPIPRRSFLLRLKESIAVSPVPLLWEPKLISPDSLIEDFFP